MGRRHNRFMVRQRAFLKLYLISLTEQKKLYGLEFLQTLKEKFVAFGFTPTHSEIYKALHELVEDGILNRYKVVKPGAKYQEVAYYRFNDKDKAERYKKQLKEDLDRCSDLIRKALADNYS